MRYNAIKNFALSRGFSIERIVADREVMNLIQSLHPVQTSISLVRIGGDSDGGYLVPDDVDGIAACFSPGVDVAASFEADIVKRGIPCFLADASVDRPPFAHELVKFEKKFLGLSEGEMTLDEWVDGVTPPQGDLLLQMDIEGAEWPILLNVSDSVLSRFRILVIEFHNLDSIFHASDLRIFKAVFARLLRHFHLLHAHPNNFFEPVAKGDIVVPRLIEMTYLRKDRAQAVGYSSVFPHPLDRPNVPSRTDFALPRGWYRSP